MKPLGRMISLLLSFLIDLGTFHLAKSVLLEIQLERSITNLSTEWTEVKWHHQEKAPKSQFGDANRQFSTSPTEPVYPNPSCPW